MAVMDVKPNITVKDLIHDNGLGLGLMIPGFVCSNNADVVGINSSNERKSGNMKIGL